MAFMDADFDERVTARAVGQPVSEVRSVLGKIREKARSAFAGVYIEESEAV